MAMYEENVQEGKIPVYDSRGVVGIHESPKEVVARAHFPDPHSPWLADHPDSRIGLSPVHLYSILICWIFRCG